MVTGAWPGGQIDHINRVRDDNRWMNLRDVSQSVNLMNSGPTKGSSSGVKGVHKHGDKWQVNIKGTYHGCYSDLSEATEVASGEYKRQASGI